MLARALGAAAETPPQLDAQGQEYRVDFSARRLHVDGSRGELSLDGDVVVSVLRYRLSGERVRLTRGPQGVHVQGGGEIGFCPCPSAPVTLGYSEVTLAPPSDVLIENATLRAGGVPVFWSPYLWLRSPDRVGLIFPSVAYRGEDGALIGAGVHVPFATNGGRPPERAIDVEGFVYTAGGARVDTRLQTPGSVSLVRWEKLEHSALLVEAWGATSGPARDVVAFEIDAARGARGRRGVTELDAAARRFDRARLLGSTNGDATFALGIQTDAPRATALSSVGEIGPFAGLATGGALGESSSWGIELLTSARAATDVANRSESRIEQRAFAESWLNLGPLSAGAVAFQSGELFSTEAGATLLGSMGAGAALTLPLVRRYGSVSHLVVPQLTTRLERLHSGDEAVTRIASLAGFSSTLGGARRAGALSASVSSGFAASLPESPELVALARAGADVRLAGMTVQLQSQPTAPATECAAELRLGPEDSSNLRVFVEAQTRRPATALHTAGGAAMHASWLSRSMLANRALSGGADLTLALSRSLRLALGGYADALKPEILAAGASATYGHQCGCLKVSGHGAVRAGRGGVDAGVSIDLMP